MAYTPPEPPVQVMGLQFMSNHENYDSSESLKAWKDLDRVLREAGMTEREWSNYADGQEYSYALRAKPDGEMARVVYVSTVEYSAHECRTETGIAHPFSRTASAVLRDNNSVKPSENYIDPESGEQF